MDPAPSTTPDQQVDGEDDESTWGTFVYALLCFAIAVVPFTPLWQQVAQPDSTHRRFGGTSRFLDSVGPVSVALTFAGLGLLLLIGTLAQRRRTTRSR